MQESKLLSGFGCRFEVLATGETFQGLGRVWIGETQVRSGRLPLRPYTQSFSSLELTELQLGEVSESADEIRLSFKAFFHPLQTKLLRDHSFDPIHYTGDWDSDPSVASARLDLVLRPAKDSFNGVAFDGFSYSYEYNGDEVPLFFLLDKASWELDGDIVGATAYSQSSCSAPVATFDANTSWTTEGLVPVEGIANVMTHNLPRWASHGSFDFQFKGDSTLIGVFERVELIRSIIQRDAGRPELKCFDKYIFDEAARFATVPKKILLNTAPKTVVDQQNLWTWIHCGVEDRARAEFGLREEFIHPRTVQNFWVNFTVEDYHRDLIPATEAIGCREVFVDNLKKSAMTERAPMPGVFNWNMCCGHEYEISPLLGGNEGVKKFVEDCKAKDIRVVSWTNNDQALSSPVNNSERDDKGWFVLLEDTRQKYGGAYAGVMSVLDMSSQGALDYFVDAHIDIKEKTGLNWYLYDSFYNLAFMPVSYRDGHPRTMWRGLLESVKRLQDADVHFLIESFGPFGAPQHGHPSSYNFHTIFICYKVGLGNDYSTVPVATEDFVGHPDDASAHFYMLAHMAGGVIPLHKDKVRVDELWTAEHKRALRDYHENLHAMKKRYLQEDGKSVLWHDAHGKRATLWNFVDREVALQGAIRDETNGKSLASLEKYPLQAGHVYSISGCDLPVGIS